MGNMGLSVSSEGEDSSAAGADLCRPFGACGTNGNDSQGFPFDFAQGKRAGLPCAAPAGLDGRGGEARGGGVAGVAWVGGAERLARLWGSVR